MSDDQALSPQLDDLGLTELQLQYVHWRGLGLNPKAAARRAGYNTSGGTVAGTVVARLESSKKIRLGIERMQDAARLRYKVDQDMVVAGIFEGINTAREQADAKAMIDGWAKIAQITGVQAPKRQEIEVKQVTADTLAHIPDHELLKHMGKDRVLSSVIDAEFVELDRPDLVPMEGNDADVQAVSEGPEQGPLCEHPAKD